MIFFIATARQTEKSPRHTQEALDAHDRLLKSH